MNYFGSKSRQAKYIVPIIQKYIEDYRISTYFEPFVGGANIIDKIECERKYGSDINKYIIALFQHLQNGGTLKESYTKEIYDKARTAWHKDNADKEFEDWEIGAIGWLCSYNGRGFDGGWGYEAMQTKPSGQVVKREFYKERKNNLLKQSAQPLWQDIHFEVGDYRDYYCNDWIWGCDEEELAKRSSLINIGIYYYDINWAKDLYNKLVTYFKHIDCLAHACYTKCVNEFFILLKNGTSYKFVKIDNTSRGQKFHSAYIEDGISDDDINEYVIPNLIPHRDVFKVVKN